MRTAVSLSPRYKEITGKTVSLGAADPNRVQLYAIAINAVPVGGPGTRRDADGVVPDRRKGKAEGWRPVSLQQAGKAEVYILMRDGTLPGQEVIEGLQEFP